MCRATGSVLVACLFALGCAHNLRVSDARGREQLGAALQRLIPPGTPAGEAMAVLKGDGFGCALSTNEQIPDLGLDGPVPEERGDFIYAERVEKVAPLIPWSGEWRWRVVLILKDGAVERYRTYFSFSDG